MSDRPSEPSVRRHITDMLEELADLAEEFGDNQLGDIALRLRLIALETVAPVPRH